MRYSLFPCMVALTVASWSTTSQGQDVPNLTGMAILKGTCEKLIMKGDDLTGHCSNQIIQSIYNTGRTGFTVTVGDKGTVMTFSGLEGAKPDPDTQLQDLDFIILNLGIEGVAPARTRVRGGCGYSNPYKGPTTISCQATGEKGEAYLLQFRSDGSPPSMTDFRQQAEAEKKQGSDTSFAAGEWAGSAMENDPEGGCLVTKQVDRKTAVMLYANKNEAFSVNIYNKDWNFGPNAEVSGELFLDGKAFSLTGVDVRNEHVLTLKAGAEEESLEGPIRESSTLSFKSGKKRIETKLNESGKAIEKLWACVDRG
ncbi:hypothetical protein GFL72_19625 [Rhizobium leguminosarum bv. viciae]|uniref:hypothetical protein n=1 Tax=Rhizobium leguminosarum TaxID=384 RepID=UPI0014426741|nr:hypothetical protein [Rhizobium leguminosarum]NKK36831.1 hypothetical protein [Rhizobium leguminosarum bv. viciae]